MRELEYQLVKDDYKNWIHWNVLRNESKKMKLFTLVICCYLCRRQHQFGQRQSGGGDTVFGNGAYRGSGDVLYDLSSQSGTPDLEEERA